MPLKPILLIFLKAPVPGRVKTRLAVGLGQKRAAGQYRRMARRIRETARGLKGIAVRWVYAPGPGFADLAWLGEGRAFWRQEAGGLGARLSRAFERAFREGGPVCVIGTDSPWLTAPDIRRAFRALVTNDVVVGPAEDGGYYLLGMRRLHAALFRGIPWSTERTLSVTLGRAEGAGLTVRRLPAGYDVDEVRGWRRWVRGSGIPGRRRRAPSPRRPRGRRPPG